MAVRNCGKLLDSLSTLDLYVFVNSIPQVMEPNTATKLKMRKGNVLKDFIHVAGPLGVTHFMIFNQTEMGTNMVCKSDVAFMDGRCLCLDASLVRDAEDRHDRPQVTPLFCARFLLLRCSVCVCLNRRFPYSGWRGCLAGLQRRFE